MRSLLILILVLLLSSCKLFKSVSKQEQDRSETEQIRSVTVQRGDTVEYVVPVTRYKDTTIYTYNRVGTRVETRYDNKGNIDYVRCIESQYEQIMEINRTLLEKINTKEKEEKAEPDKYLIFGIILILGLLAGYFFRPKK